MGQFKLGKWSLWPKPGVYIARPESKDWRTGQAATCWVVIDVRPPIACSCHLGPSSLGGTAADGCAPVLELPCTCQWYVQVETEVAQPAAELQAEQQGEPDVGEAEEQPAAHPEVQKPAEHPKEVKEAGTA